MGHALRVAAASLCGPATRSVGGCRLLGIMHLGWCPRVSLFELVLGRMARPATRSVLVGLRLDRKSTRLNSSHVAISYAVFCLKKKSKFVVASWTADVVCWTI